MSEGSGGSSSAPQSLPSSGSSGSLVAEVDESPLQKTMDKNKESLKVKLMMRRPINQLVAQGIMPSLKTPPAFHEQRQKLERAKMGDLLKAKIQQRPDREELVRQHILEADVGHVDPSLAERQRMLKKARLADSLNDQLSHRPGPLELIKKNILHTEEPIERAVKEGVIPFKATSEGQLRKPQHPDHYITFEDDSQSSEGAGSPSNTPSSFTGHSLPTLDNIASSVTQSTKTKESRPRDVLETAAASAGIVNVAVTIPTNAVVVTSPILQQIPNDKTQTLQTFAELCSSVVSPLSLGSSTSSLSPLSSIASPPTPLTPRPAPLSSPAPGKADKNRKKSKTKTQPKARTIKFHEYKGPPNAQKNTSVSASSTETSYELLLQQQQLFLQWQLEWQHKYPQIILPAAQKPSAENISNLQNTISSITNSANNTGTTFLVTQSPRSATPVIQPSTPQSRPPSSPPQPDSQVSSQNSTSSSTSFSSTSTVRVLTKLEDMKVSDLKMELKKRNLPVSGPKPQLIERLKPFTQSGSGENGGHPGDVTSSNGRTISMSSGDNPGSVVSEMDVSVSPSAQEEDDGHFSPAAKTCSPSPSSPTPSAMDTSEPSPPTSPSNGEMIIQQQQRKIEELQRQLQKSQQQLQQIREGKESSNLSGRTGNNSASTTTTTTVTTTTTTTTMTTTITSPIPVKALLQNGVIHIDPKSQQKLILQQHLQNKIQQQQLQIQLQQQQQQQQGAHQFNETVNAKANLAAFINQQQAQHQLNSILQAASNNNNNSNSINSSNSNSSSHNNNSNNNNSINNNYSNNNKNNNNNINNSHNHNSNGSNTSSNLNNNNIISNSNNNGDSNDNISNNTSNNNSNNIKNKLAGRRSIVLGQQQAAIVLNHLNLVKQKNGILGHQRTSSLPTFLGTLVQNTEKQSSQAGKIPLQKVKNQNLQPRRAGSEEQQTFIVTSKPPPQYEEATKSLKQDSEESKTSKSVKSQIVDDVLEILIKNGELPPSAANDPSTTPSRSGPYDSETGLLYPLVPDPPPPPPLPQPGFSVTLPTSITLTSQSQPPSQFNFPNTTFSNGTPFTLTTQSLNPPIYTLTQAYLPSSGDREAVAESEAITNNITFSISNPNFVNAENSSNKNTFSSGINYLDNTEFMSTETSDFDLNNSSDQNFHSNSLDYILSSNDNLLPSDLSSSDNILPSEYGNGDINLKELGLDLETLDSMDFSQLDCKMDANDTDMESGTTTSTTKSAAGTAGAGRKSSSSSTTNKTDQLINNNPDLVKPELMEPMEMDDNWLDSLMPISDGQTGSQFNNSLTPSSNVNEFLPVNDSSYESLLGNPQDPFELFDMHDNDFKLPSSSLLCDKLDFAT